MTTDKLIQSANTSNGFAIGIVHNARSGKFLVVRMDRQSRFITISAHVSESDARIRANREWAADRQAMAA